MPRALPVPSPPGCGGERSHNGSKDIHDTDGTSLFREVGLDLGEQEEEANSNIDKQVRCGWTRDWCTART